MYKYFQIFINVKEVEMERILNFKSGIPRKQWKAITRKIKSEVIAEE